ncbi:unnamed protein product [Rhizophagus irregularis]|nr:unnamed protein product [Rhizophagus irregularis]
MSVHLTTDLWTARSKHGYIGVTATWLSSDFTFYEVLLTCSHLEYPHTGETISDELYRIIDQWRLKNTIFTISTYNGSNMVKAAQRLRESQFEINNQDVSIIEESQIQTSPLDVLSDTKT